MADENDVAYYYSSGTIAEPLSSVSDEEYESPVFVPSRLVDRISNVPRFAHSPSIAYAASGDDQARQDYLEGAVFTSSIILLAFVVWLVILLVLKIMGSKRVGCASGKAPTYPSLESIQAANHTLERSTSSILRGSRQRDGSAGRPAQPVAVVRSMASWGRTWTNGCRRSRTSRRGCGEFGLSL